MMIPGSHFSIEDTRKRNIFGDGLYGNYFIIAYKFQDLFAIEYDGETEGGGIYLWNIYRSDRPSFLDIDEKHHIKILGVDAYDF